MIKWLKHIKKRIKLLHNLVCDFAIRQFYQFSIARIFPKGRNYIYDMILEDKSRDKKIVFDVGAHIGESAIYFNKIFKDSVIYSFEPVLETFQLLQRHAKHKNIKCYNLAIGNKNVTITIQTRGTSSTNSLVPVQETNHLNFTEQEVRVKTIDSLIKEYQIDKIDLLKIDVEGYEMNVLNGAENTLKSGKIKYIVCEVGFNDSMNKTDFGLINTFLKNYGYGLCGFYNTYRWGAFWPYKYGHNHSYVRFSDAMFRKFDPITE